MSDFDFSGILNRLSVPRLAPGDYAGEDWLLYCGKCRTPKQFRMDAPPLAGRLLPCPCQCEQERLDREAAEQENRRHRQIVADLKRQGFTDPAMRDWTFANDNGKCQQMKHARFYVENWPAMQAENIGYPICCGMDVHKSFVVACIATTNDCGVTTYKSKRFSTFTNDLRRCAVWLAENHCKDVCMESTGKYWIPIYNILETTCTVVLAHPKYVKAIRGKKTDKKDAKLTNFTTGEKNRAQNCLTVSNIKLDDVFSDVFGKAASAITARLLENNEPFDVTPYLTKGIKAPVEKIQAAVDAEMCAEQAEKLRIIRSHMDALELCKLNLQSLILTTAEKYLPQLNIVATAPGIPTLEDWTLTDAAMEGMELCPSYFGSFPVPPRTPWGWTLRHRPLDRWRP